MTKQLPGKAPVVIIGGGIIGLSTLYHLAQRGFRIESLTANGDWYALLRQEITRLGGLERQRGNWSWPLAYAYALLGLLYFKLRSNKRAEDLACFGWQCVAVKLEK